jgi:hypothetical protein
MSAPLFHQALLREHFEEITSLYEQRIDRLCDWESTPCDVVEIESRIEAHLDGLVLAGEAAIAVGLAVVDRGDPWSYYAMVALACRLDRFEYVRVALLVLEGLRVGEHADEWAAARARQAIGDALVHHMPDERAELVAAALHNASPHTRPVLATCIGTRCWVQAGNELRRAAVEPSDEPEAVLRALSRLPTVAPGLLLANVGSPDASMAQTAAIGALRRGDTAALDFLVQNHQLPWTALPLAMAGSAGAGPWLAKAARSGQPTEALLALGLLGDPTHVPVLLANLSDTEHAVAAAVALFLITGAQLQASDRDDDEDHDERGPNAGVTSWASLHGSGISIEPVAWTTWMDAHGHRLRPGQRHRLGIPTTAQADLEVLSQSPLPLWLRRLLADEFVIRYGVQWSYHPDLLVTRQRQILAPVRERLDDPRLRFVDGAWHFQGRALDGGGWR